MAHEGNGFPNDHVAEPDAVILSVRNGTAVACAACGMTSDTRERHRQMLGPQRFRSARQRHHSQLDDAGRCERPHRRRRHQHRRRALVRTTRERHRQMLGRQRFRSARQRHHDQLDDPRHRRQPVVRSGTLGATRPSAPSSARLNSKPLPPCRPQRCSQLSSTPGARSPSALHDARIPSQETRQQ
jgi:hypothetical protein